MTSRRAVLLVGCTLGVRLVAPLAAGAQPGVQVRRIGYLFSGSAPAEGPEAGVVAVQQPSPQAFRQVLRELGWIEGRNIVIDARFADGRFDRLPDLAAELVRLKVDVIVAWPTPAAVAAKNATATIPIVMWGVGDPVGLGLIESLARPGGNVTGMSFSVGLETFSKALGLLKETIPKVRLVAILSNPGNPAHALAMTDVKAAGRSLGVQLRFVEARGPDGVDRAFAAMAKGRVEAVFVLGDSMFVLHRARIADLAVKNRLPSMHAVRENVEAGGLISYGPSTVAAAQRAAFFVDKILKGAGPAELPVEQPTKFELVINLKTAKALGLTIPPAVLIRADEVIHP